jgi:hypothetical protein
MDKPYAISSVIIKKSMTPDEALDHALNITKKKKLKMTELKNTYRFRNIPKTKFSDFRSKKINKDITLVFGELKPEFARLQGSGFLDYFKKGYDYIKEKAGDVVDKVKDVFSPRIDSYNNATKRMLQEYGNGVITKITIYRKPLSDYLPMVLNAVSLGKWGQLQKKYGIDKFFHLSLICVVNGQSLNVEKNEVISITKGVPSGEGVESQEVPLGGKSFTLNQMMEKARQDAGDKTFFTYSALGANNCQNFLSYLLKGQGLYDDHAKSFIFQDISGMVDELPDYVKKFAQGTTDLAGTFNKLTGQGQKEEIQKFIAFLQTKNLKKKPGDAQLKRLYREFKGVKRLSGKGFWDDFKRGFNMVFEPASKYVLKPLMALSGTPMGLAGVAGLSALGYGRSGGNKIKADPDNQIDRDVQAFSTARDVFNTIPQDMINQAKEGAKEGLKRFAIAGLGDYIMRKKGGAMSLEDTFKQFGENMKGQYNMVKSTLGLGKPHLAVSQFHRWLALNAHKHPNDTLRALFKKYSNSK